MAKIYIWLPILLLGYKPERSDNPEIHAQPRVLVFTISPSMYTGAATSGMRDVRLHFNTEQRDNSPRGQMMQRTL
jgi:hypothetical protein